VRTTSDEFLKRFEREAKIVTSFDHPNISYQSIESDEAPLWVVTLARERLENE
jgi:hypothetical protein